MRIENKLICVTLCTLHRPKMLERCLKSIVGQEVPDGWEMFIAVVENTAEPANHELVQQIAQSSNVAVIYETEPTQGIPVARNRTLDIALRQNADWIAFIDDDEVAQPGWIKAFCDATERVDVEVFCGTTLLEFPPGTPVWMPKGKTRAARTGTITTRVYTCNTFMKSELAAVNGLGLRFDERMRFSGGSDTDYFKRAFALGSVAAFVEHAVVVEEVPPVRTSLRWQLQRAMRVNATMFYIRRKRLPLARILRSDARKLLLYTYEGLKCFFASGIYLFIDSQECEKLEFYAMRNFASAAGLIAGLVGYKIDPYTKIDGH